MSDNEIVDPEPVTPIYFVRAEEHSEWGECFEKMMYRATSIFLDGDSFQHEGVHYRGLEIASQREIDSLCAFLAEHYVVREIEDEAQKPRSGLYEGGEPIPYRLFELTPLLGADREPDDVTANWNCAQNSNSSGSSSTFVIPKPEWAIIDTTATVVAGAPSAGASAATSSSLPPSSF